MTRELEYRIRCGDRLYVLPRGQSVVGRDPGCDIQLDGDLVSRRHVRLCVEPGRLVLEDLGSSNGSLVNEVRVEKPFELRGGDRIRIGLSVLEVETSLKQRCAAPTLRLIHCDACGAILADEMWFCVQCGHQLRRKGALPACTSCGDPLRRGDSDCASCGAPVDTDDGSPAAS